MKKNETVVDPRKQKWEKIKIPGIQIKFLHQDKRTGASLALLKFKKGAGMPEPHVHASNQFMYVIKGRLSYPGIKVGEGMLYINPKDHIHGPSRALEDSLVLEIYDGPHYYPDKKPY